MAADSRAWLACGVVFGAEQIELRLRDIHLRKADVHRGPKSALRQRADLPKRQAPQIERRLRNFEDGLRRQRLIVCLLHFDQHLSAGIGHVLILRCVAQLRALLQAGGASEIGQQLVRDHARRGAAVDAGRGDGAGRENRAVFGPTPVTLPESVG